MTTITRKPGRFFYLGWILLNTTTPAIAWLITLGVVSLIVRIIGDTLQVSGQTRITEDIMFSYVFFPIFGFFSGCLQYLLLCRHLPEMVWWIIATGLGWIFLLILIHLLPAEINLSIWIQGIVIALFGGVSGLAQWLVLRRKVGLASLWILACAIGWGLTYMVIGKPLPSPIELFPLGLIPALTTAIGLGLLLGRLPGINNGSGKSS